LCYSLMRKMEAVISFESSLDFRRLEWCRLTKKIVCFIVTAVRNSRRIDLRHTRGMITKYILTEIDGSENLDVGLLGYCM
jgi:hypothetical protein